MDCPACGHANREVAKYCARCATELPAVCAGCGAALGSHARFCDQCGEQVERGSRDAGDGGDRATRKVVTVLFADLAGSTSFGERVDAESAREAMVEYHAMAATAIESAGGTVAKFIGDGVMALFGVPETAEDDADRAVRAGLDLQQGFAPIRDRIARRHGADLGLRVGINTGELVLADGDADLVGDTINVAARLEAACTPGHVLVGEDTWRLTRSHVRYDVSGEVDVKGKDVPVATFQVIADDTDGADDQATPFVGRGPELARLREAFDESVRLRAARLVTVIGAPGVGKTRIAREFVDSLGNGATFAGLRCERPGAAAFAPIADLLRSLVALDDDNDQARVRAAVGDLVADLDDADRVAGLLAGFLGAAPARSTEEAFLAVRRLVETTGRRRPLVVVVDDIQWAEPLFLDLLEHLADWVSDAPALLVGLARPELRDSRPSLAETSRTVAASIGLEGLDASATAELAARLVGADSLPSDLVERLPESTEGNPLFVRELMRMLVDDGVIEDTDGGWQLTIDAEAVEVPPTIQSLLAARLDRMPAEERRVVELASVVGPEFALGALATISDSAGPDLRLVLDRLRRRELIESTGVYWGDEPIYRFHHVLIRDAAYRRLLKRTRADLHLQVGEWTERSAAGVTGEHDVAIAYHYEQAHEYRRQLDDVDEAMAAVGRRAAELLGVAAERSLERDDLKSASTLAERALDRLDPGDAMIPPMLVVAAEALLALGDVERGRPVIDRLVDVVAQDERQSPWAAAFVAQLTMLSEPGRLRDAAEAADRAARQLAELGDEAGVAKARLVRAGALARLGQVGACESELDVALTAARSADDRRRVAAVLGAAPVAALWGPSPIPRAGGRCLDVIRLLRITTGSPAVEATSVRCQAVLEALRGRFGPARSMLADARATVEELGLRHALNETDQYIGIVELLAGDPVAAEPPLRAAYQGLGRLGIGADAGQAAAYLARAVLQQGRLDEAEELAASSAAVAGENPQTAIAARAVQAEILAARGQIEAAVATAREAVELAAGTDIVVDHANANAVLARVCRLAGDVAGADRAAVAAVALYEQKGAKVVVDGVGPRRSGAHESTVSTVLVGVDADHGSIDRVGTGAHSEEPAAGPPDGDFEPWNEADRLVRKIAELFLDPTSDAWLDMLDPDLVSDDRQAVVGHLASGRDVAARLWTRDHVDDDAHSEIETLAVRGDRLALHRGRNDFPATGTESDRVYITRWTEDGKVDLNVRFDPGDIADAVDELDRLFLESVDPSSCEAFQVRAYGSAYRSLREGRLDQAMDLLSARYVQRDHRAMGWPTVDRAGMRERLSTMRSDGDLLPFLARIERLDGLVALCRSEVRVTSELGAEQVDGHLLVSVLDPETGQVASVDQFSLDQPGAAGDRFEELVADVARRGERWNAASLVGGWVATTSRLGRDDLRGDLLGPGSELIPSSHHRQVLAVRGDRLALVAHVDEQSMPYGFQLEELDQHGRLASIESFPADDLIGAVDRCDRRWSEVDPAPTEVGRLLVDYSAAWRARDIDALASMLDDSFLAVDHRPLGRPELDKEQQLAAMAALAPNGDVGVATTDWLVATEFGSVAPYVVIGRDHVGRLTESPQSIVACVVSDGRIVRNELFSVDDPRRAIARFEELTVEAPPARPEPWNEADRLTRRFIESFTAGAREEWLPMLSPHQVTNDRRPLVGVDTAGADEVADAYPRDRESGELSSSAETVAVRGESLALVRWHAVSSHGREWDAFHLTRWTADGLNDLNVIFPTDQLVAAVHELEQLYLQELGDSIEALQMRELARGASLISAGDVDAFLALHDADFVMRDHRRLGWPEVSAEQYRARLESVFSLEAEVLVYQERVLRLDASTSVCAPQRVVVRLSDGSEQVQRSVVVMMMDPYTGLITSFDQFEEDQVAEAVTRFDELIARSGRVLHNEASQRALFVNSWLRRGDDELLAGAMADDAELVDEHGEPFDLAPVERRHVMAVRGERVALVHVTGPDARFVVEHLDGRGRIDRIERFALTSLDAAYERMHELYLPELDEPEHAVATAAVRLVHALVETDVELVASLLSDDFRAVDHRSLGDEEVDRAAYLASVMTTISVAGSLLADEIIRLTSDGIVVSASAWVIDDDGALTESFAGIRSMMFRDGRFWRVERFEPDDVDGALARFDDLAASTPATRQTSAR